VLDEASLRKPGFTEGPRIVLGDGQAWTFPRPRLRLYPVRAAEGRFTVGGAMGYGSNYADLVDQLVECDPGDTSARLALQFQMATSLLELNYTLSDRDFRRLLAIDLADPECESRWAQINQVLLGHPPKPLADGSATPFLPTGSPGN
jgi:hypothetical protein